MATEGVCPFPLPPSQYYKLYTDENVEKQIAPVPPPPVGGAYSMFGAPFEVLLSFAADCYKKAFILLLRNNPIRSFLKHQTASVPGIDVWVSYYFHFRQMNLSSDL